MRSMRNLRAPLRLIFFLLTLALLPATSWAQLTTIAVGMRPESVVKGWQGKYFVSVQGTTGPGDGEIKMLDLDAGTATLFTAGLDNPRGLAFTGDNLVVTDTTRVWIIDQQGGKAVLADAPAFPHPIEFLNDATSDRGGKAVFVTEMGARSQLRDPATNFLWPVDTYSVNSWTIEARSRIYRITLDGKVKEVVTPSRKLLSINGVGLSNEKGRLLAVDFFFGNLVEVTLDKPNRRKMIATGFRGADGVEQDSDGNIYISTFENGAVWKLDSEGETVKVLLDGVGRQSTADFYLDDKKNLLLVPDTAHGLVIVLPTE